MPNNPVQIVLNDTDFHAMPDPGQPPRPKDFFANADREFIAHRKRLATDVQRIIEEVENSAFGPATYLKVRMRTEALAKSYRPVYALFKPDQFPCVGAEAVGTLFFRAPLIYLRGLKARIEEAEDEVRTVFRQSDGAPYPAPTVRRAEVGAIESISIVAPSEKRNFSTSAAMDMFADPSTVSGYQIDLFEALEPEEIAADATGRTELYRSLVKLLVSFGPGTRTLLSMRLARMPVLEFQLTQSDAEAIVDNRLGLVRTDIAPSAVPTLIDRNADRHEAALSALQRHPLVRAIRPPIRLQLVDEEMAVPEGKATTKTAPIPLPLPSQDARYPIVGVIDSGIAPILDEWVVDRFDFLDTDDYDALHGTMVAGLITVGQQINGPDVARERDGCQIVDIPLYPNGDFLAQYPNGFSEFLSEVEQAVSEAREKHGVRIFNLSINATAPVERYTYSTYAAELDRIADTYDVVFVNSAGNLKHADARAPWPTKPNDVIKYFANRTSSDTILKPAESVRSISVGALNPLTDDKRHITGAPTVYTRRGPGLQVGIKPDLAAYGGAGISTPGAKTGLTSIDQDGVPIPVIGTSFAAPLVARSLAGLDAATSGGLTSEALRAMLIHNAAMPDPLTKRGLKDLARQFAGFGQPVSAQDMLETGDNEITLLFQSRLQIGEKKPVILRFPFTWPQSLVAGGKCSGRARITLVYAPPLDPAFGAEFVRVNLEASLKQRQTENAKDGSAHFTTQIDAKFLPKKANLAIPEKALIDHGLKWWPVKQYAKSYENHGASSEWRLEVTSLVRAETTFPAEGVPFAVLLTIDDPSGAAPVYREMQQALQASRANTQALQTVFRVRPRR
ncbi:MAG: S8 family peptidase [Acidobacteria bacterium]|nr:S8 family peptidase [Acidobacteriota bacterium]